LLPSQIPNGCSLQVLPGQLALRALPEQLGHKASL
jgi:hypothetical protein